MTIHGGATADRHKQKKLRSREVSSRFLPSFENANQSSKEKPKPSSDTRKHRSFENAGFFRGLWPSSSSSSSQSPVSTNLKSDTLADCIGNDRIRDKEEKKSKSRFDQNPLILNRQRSCTEFGRFDDAGDRRRINSKENYKPLFGGSMRYTAKLRLGENSSDPDRPDQIIAGRFSVDENSIRKKSSGLSLDTDTLGSESEYSDIYSGETTPVAGKVLTASYMAPTVSSRKHGIEVPSKFLRELSSRSRRWSADSDPDQKPVPSDNNNNNSPAKSSGNLGFSSGRADGKGKMKGLASPKPPTSPSRGKGKIGNILSLGIELLKGKKSSSGATSSSPLRPGFTENVHQLRLFHSRLVQWRFGNARAEAVNRNIVKRAQKNFLQAWSALIKLQQTVLKKRLQLQREKLEWKLYHLLHSQIKALEIWGSMERLHTSGVCNTIDSLHSVVCRIPLVDGAKAELQMTSFTVRRASDLAASINSMLTTSSPTIEKAVGMVSDLAVVVRQEKLLLEECLDICTDISSLEMQERSLKSSIMQLQQQHMLAKK